MKKLFSLIIALILTFVSFNAFGFSNKKVPVLMYHNINDDYSLENKSVEMSSSEFESQLSALKRNGYTAISLYDFIDYKNSVKDIPDKPVIITFDDGYLNNYTIAYPLLKQYNMKATIFIITGRMNVSSSVLYPHFTWEQAKEMQNSGLIDIESHTNYHNKLSEVSPSTRMLELRKSKYLIYKNIGKDSKILAFPYGYYNKETLADAKNSGYEACVIISDEELPGVNDKDSSLYELKRITASGGMSGEELINFIEENIKYGK